MESLLSSKNKIKPSSSHQTEETEEAPDQGDQRKSFEIESTKIFTSLVEKLEVYYEEKMKIEVEGKSISIIYNSNHQYSLVLMFVRLFKCSLFHIPVGEVEITF